LGVSLFSTLKFSSENAQCHLDCTSFCHKKSCHLLPKIGLKTGTCGLDKGKLVFCI
jgi:hypothetical protein